MMNNKDNSIVEIIQHQEIRQEAKKVYKSQEEIYKELYLSPRNKVFKDGRIYGGKDKFGNYIAYSISPNYEKFNEQVERKVWPIVKALKEKGYHTISSCEGHPKRLMVKIGFDGEESRDIFMEYIKKHTNKKKYIDLIPHNNCANLNTEITDSGKIVSTRALEHELVTRDILKAETKAFNFQFNENYKQWHFLDIIMFPDNTINPIKSKLIFRSAIKNKEEYVNDIVDYISSENFPHYKKILFDIKKSRF